ncbi:MAG: ATP synthase F0 subunit C [Pirellulales bacterium]
MIKLARILVVFAVVCLFAVPAMAQAPTAPVTIEPAYSLINITNYLGVGLVVIGAAFGISKLAAAAYEGMSRQPEVAGNIQTAMIIAAALIEGFTFYALFICSTVAK